VRLGLEALESRDCPSGPSITLTATTLPGHSVQLSGTVTDSNPAFVQVSFTGAYSGNTTTDSTGHYSLTTASASLGTVSATGVDMQHVSTNTAQAQITDAAPTVQLSLSYGSGRWVTLTGKVTDIDPGGQRVNFSGVVNSWVTTNADGTFSLTTQASALGTITAGTTDSWQQSSAPVKVTVACPAPVISNFTASGGPNRVWTFSGQVAARNASELTINFGGIPSLKGETVQVAADGTFTLSVVLQPGEMGMVWAETTDCWGQASNTAFAYVSPA
jgi:hypothetical protein